MWSTLLPYVLVTLVLVLTPGFVINWAAGFRPLTAIGLGPLVSTGVVASSAIVANLLGLPWGPLPIVLATALWALAGWGVKRALAGRFDEVRSPSSQGGQQAGAGWALAAWGIAAVLLAWDAVRILGKPTNFSQTFDNIFHLNAVRWIVENRNGSSLDMRMVSGEAPATFYPSAWHDFASSALLTMGSHDAVAGTNALVIVTLTAIWPLSVLVLVRRILPAGQDAAGLLAAGVLVAAFTPFPYLLLRFGVLYPNLLGLCLLPAVIAIAADVLGLGERPRWPLGASLVVAAVGMVGLMLAHPNVALTMVALIGPVMVAAWALPAILGALRRRAWTRDTAIRFGVLAAWSIGSLACYVYIRPPQVALFWGPVRTLPDAVVEALLVSPLEAPAVVVAALLVLMGAVAVVRRRRGWWLLVSHGVLCLLWLVAAARERGRFRDYLLGPFYNDPYRLAAMLPITALPLAVLGVAFLAERLAALTVRRDLGHTRDTTALPIVLAVLLAATTQFAGGKPQMVDWVNESYLVTPRAALVDSDEYAVLQQVGDLVPPDDTIAVNPWNGSSMAYALTGRDTTATHVLYTPGEDEQVLIDNLDDVATDPDVCPAIRDLSVRWVLDFGNSRLINNEKKPFPGWDDLADAPGFEVAFQSGSAVLYRVTACGMG